MSMTAIALSLALAAPFNAHDAADRRVPPPPAAPPLIRYAPVVAPTLAFPLAPALPAPPPAAPLPVLHEATQTMRCDEHEISFQYETVEEDGETQVRLVSASSAYPGYRALDVTERYQPAFAAFRSISYMQATCLDHSPYTRIQISGNYTLEPDKPEKKFSITVPRPF